MTYPDSVQFLYSLGNEVKTVKLGLERIARLLDGLNNPERSLEIVHVAGTNGKGSTSAMIESGLRAAGRRTGLFTSPHLVEPTERLRIDGRPVTAEQFVAVFDRVHGAAERLIESGAIDMHPTYFETVTAMALVAFREWGAGSVVLEVGLGGRLDATNVVRPRIAVITPVDYDHEALLGKSIEAIAGEKAGILKAGVPAVFARQRGEAEAVLSARAADLGVPVRRTREWPVTALRSDAYRSRFRAGGMELTCPLAGMHQVENALTAALTLDALGLAPGEIAGGIARTHWPGRLERVADRPEIILDGAHNPAGARALAAYINRFFDGRRVWLVYGAMRDKAVEEMGAILFPLADEIVATAPRQARSVRPETIRELADHPRLRTAGTLEDALALVRREAAPEDAVFVSGSLFLAGEARRLLCR